MKILKSFQIIGPVVVFPLAGIIVLASSNREVLPDSVPGSKSVPGFSGDLDRLLQPRGGHHRGASQSPGPPCNILAPPPHHQPQASSPCPSSRWLEKRSSPAVRKLLAALDTSKPLAAGTFDQVRGAEIGNKVVISLPGADLRGELDSRLSTGPIQHYGVTLEDGLGRMVLSLNDGDKINGHVFFEGEERALTLSGSQSGDQGWTVEENLVLRGYLFDVGNDLYRRSEGRCPRAEWIQVRLSRLHGEGGAEDAALPILNSRPGAADVIYLDFDGEVVTHPSWNDGNQINALPPSQLFELGLGNSCLESGASRTSPL